MSRRPKGSPPSYRLHKQSGQAIVSLPLGGGTYRDVLLGRHGSPESYAEYARVIAEWQTAGCVAPPPKAGAADLTVGELLLRFWRRHVEVHYRDPDGNPPPKSTATGWRYGRCANSTALPQPPPSAR